MLVFPSASAPHHDTRLYFLEQRRWFFALVLAVVATSVLKDLVREDLPDLLNLGFHGAYAVIGLSGFLVESERFQHGLAYTGLSLFVIYIGLLFAQL